MSPVLDRSLAVYSTFEQMMHHIEIQVCDNFYLGYHMYIFSCVVICTPFVLQILIQSACETMVPKLVAEDIPLLHSLLSDVFPGVQYTRAEMGALRAEIYKLCTEMHLVAGEGDSPGAQWVEKVRGGKRAGRGEGERRDGERERREWESGRREGEGGRGGGRREEGRRERDGEREKKVEEER